MRHVLGAILLTQIFPAAERDEYEDIIEFQIGQSFSLSLSNSNDYSITRKSIIIGTMQRFGATRNKDYLKESSFVFSKLEYGTTTVPLQICSLKSKKRR